MSMYKLIMKKGSYKKNGKGNPILQEEIIKVLKAYENGLPIYIFMEELDKAKTTIHDNLRILKEKGLLYKTKEYTCRKGRPMTIWNLKEGET